jgi:hypothetical protein
MDAPPQERDELSRDLDAWQAEAAVRLNTEYGHSWAVASGIAALQRDLLEDGMRKPQRLLLPTF